MRGAPRAKPFLIWNDSLHGFGCIIHPAGARWRPASKVRVTPSLTAVGGYAARGRSLHHGHVRDGGTFCRLVPGASSA